MRGGSETCLPFFDLSISPKNPSGDNVWFFPKSFFQRVFNITSGQYQVDRRTKGVRLPKLGCITCCLVLDSSCRQVRQPF